MFFSYDHENGIEFHDTAEQAKARAEASFGYDEDDAPEGWHEEVESICWGEVRQKVTETHRCPARADAGYTEHVEYELQDKPAHTAAALTTALDRNRALQARVEAMEGQLREIGNQAIKCLESAGSEDELERLARRALEAGKEGGAAKPYPARSVGLPNGGGKC